MERYIWAACVQSIDGYWSVDVLYRLLISNKKKALNNCCYNWFVFVSSCLADPLCEGCFIFALPQGDSNLALRIHINHLYWFKNICLHLCVDILHLLLFYQCSAWFMHWNVIVCKIHKVANGSKQRLIAFSSSRWIWWVALSGHNCKYNIVKLPCDSSVDYSLIIKK